LKPSSGQTTEPISQCCHMVGKLISLAIHQHIKVHILLVK